MTAPLSVRTWSEREIERGLTVPAVASEDDDSLKELRLRVFPELKRFG